MVPEHLSLLLQAYGSGEFVIEAESKLSGQGSNYLGVVTAVTLEGKTRPGTLHVIMKTAQNDLARSTRAILPAFQRELELYSNVLPGLLNFQAAFSLSSPFTAAPAYYAGTLLAGKEALLLEDLRQRGFQLWQDQDGLDFEHQAAVFREYARLHAISLAFRAKQPEQFLALTRKVEWNFLEERAAQQPELYEIQRQVVFDISRRALQGQNEQSHERFEAHYRRFLQEGPEEELVVVCHGDCHPNNIMFQYHGNSGPANPERVALIDWQLSSLGSPMRDLTFVFFTCASKEVLLRSEELLNIYHSTIGANLQEFGCDVEQLLSLETLKRHWNKYSPYGLYRALVVLKLILITPEEVKASSSILDVIRQEFSMSSKFAQRVRGLFQALTDEL